MAAIFGNRPEMTITDLGRNGTEPLRSQQHELPQWPYIKSTDSVRLFVRPAEPKVLGRACRPLARMSAIDAVTANRGVATASTSRVRRGACFPKDR